MLTLPATADDSLIGIYEELSSPTIFEPRGIAVRVEGIASDTGKIIIIAFEDARTFSSFGVLGAAGSASISAETGSIEHRFEMLTQGPYAVFSFHDENNDATLNTENGNPTEGFAYSKESTSVAGEEIAGGLIKGLESPPSFSEAVVSGKHISVKIQYPE
jgi:uncharacterized protein (DUF2141 family)